MHTSVGRDAPGKAMVRQPRSAIWVQQLILWGGDISKGGDISQISPRYVSFWFPMNPHTTSDGMLSFEPTAIPDIG